MLGGYDGMAVAAGGCKQGWREELREKECVYMCAGVYSGCILD